MKPHVAGLLSASAVVVMLTLTPALAKGGPDQTVPAAGPQAGGQPGVGGAAGPQTGPTPQAQEPGPSDGGAPAGKEEKGKSAEKAAEKPANPEGKPAEKSTEQTEKPADKAATFKYVTRQNPTDWSAEALIGRTVENPQGENVGDINNVILSEKGNVVAVTIGVGGFLGIGEKDVGVPFDALQFRPADEVSHQDRPTAPDRQVDKNDRKQQTATEDKVQQPTNQEQATGRFDTEHGKIKIILDVTREQLEAAPEFAWLDEQHKAEKPANPEGKPAEKAD